MFLCYKNPQVWPPRIEAAEFDRLPRLLAAALVAKKPDMKREVEGFVIFVLLLLLFDEVNLRPCLVDLDTVLRIFTKSHHYLLCLMWSENLKRIGRKYMNLMCFFLCLMSVVGGWVFWALKFHLFLHLFQWQECGLCIMLGVGFYILLHAILFDLPNTYQQYAILDLVASIIRKHAYPICAMTCS